MNNSSKKNKTCAVIPFFNEVRTLRTVVEKVDQFVDYIIAVDDGSNDGSAETINRDSARITILRNTTNKGKGYCLRKGLENALSNGFSEIVTLDADMQHDPDYIKVLLAELSNCDFVIGNRLNNLEDMPIHRIASNKITSFMLSARFNQNILDSQCGFRAFKAEIVKSILPDNNGFEAETEMIIKAMRAGIKIGFVPIPTIYGEEKSKMRNLQATLGFLKVYFTA